MIYNNIIFFTIKKVYVVSTFLDPNFGLDVFPPEKKERVKKTIKDLLVAVQVSRNPTEEIISKNPTRLDNTRSNMFTFYKDNELETNDIIDNIDLTLDKFIRLVSMQSKERSIEALEFWRTH